MGVTTDITAYYKMEGNGNDATGRGNNGSPHGSVTYAAGKVGDCVKSTGAFMGGAQWLEVPTSADVEPGARPFAVWGWFKISQLSGVSYLGSNLLGKGGNDVGGFSYSVAVNIAAPKMEFTISHDGTNTSKVTIVADTPLIAVDTWYFVIAWWDGSNVYIQVDNGAIYTTAWSLDAFECPGSLDICWPNNTTFITTWVDEVGIRIGSVPTVEDRDCLYNAGAGGTFPSFCTQGMAFQAAIARSVAGVAYSNTGFGAKTELVVAAPTAGALFSPSAPLVDMDGAQPGEAVTLRVERDGDDALDPSDERCRLRTVTLRWYERPPS
jgi:hypothetical protein